MSEADLATALDWARSEGWNLGLGDAALFHAADPEGFLVADDPEGAPAASISTVRVVLAHMFLGLFICRTVLRGQGYAGPLWRAAMERAGEASIGLDGVAAEHPRYVERGFRATHRTVRHAGRVKPGSADAGSRPATPSDMRGMLALDRTATGFSREVFLQAWMSPAPDRIVRVVDGPEALIAAGVMRACREGWKIGPLHATSEDAAERLLSDLASLAEGRPIMFDAPEDTPQAAAIARSLGLSPVFETARMWRGAPPQRETGVEYGSATLELG